MKRSIAAILVAVLLCLLTSPVRADLESELGYLNLTANGGINPATGLPWEFGDAYRLIFLSSEGTKAQSTDIAYYNTFIQDLATAAGLGGVWKALGSTVDVDARDNTSTNWIDGDGFGESIWELTSHLEGDDYEQFWTSCHTMQRTELLEYIGDETFTNSVWGGTYDHGAGDNAGTANTGDELGAIDGTAARGTVTQCGRWLDRENSGTGKNYRMYGLSEPLHIAGVTMFTFTWDGDAGLWGTATDWTPDTGPPAGATHVAVIDSAMATVASDFENVVRVSADRAVYRLIMTDPTSTTNVNEVIIDPNTKLEVQHLIAGDGPNSIVLADGSSLVVGSTYPPYSEHDSALYLLATVNPGTAVISTARDLPVELYVEYDSVTPTPRDRILEKQGAGTLTMDNTTGGIISPNTQFKVTEGTLALAGADPLGGSTAPLLMNGGAIQFSRERGVVPLAHYSFDGATLEEDSYADNDLVNGGTVVQDLVTTKFGAGSAYFPNDLTGYFDIPLKDVLDSDAGTASFWIKTGYGFPDKDGVMFRAGGSDGTIYTAIKGGDADVTKLWVTLPGQDDRNNSGSAQPNDNNWHHMVLVWEKDKDVNVYVDGIEDTGTRHYGGYTDFANILTLGRPDRNYQGLMDEVWLYDMALNEDEMAALYATNAGSVPQPVLDLTANDVEVNADGSTLDVTTTLDVDFGALKLSDGILTITGTDISDVSFTGTDIMLAAVGKTVGVKVEVSPLDIGDIDGTLLAGGAATFVKEGSEDLILSQTNVNIDSTIFEPREGRLIAVIGPAGNPFNAATVRFSTTAGELALSSEAGAAINFTNNIVVDGPGTVTAGQFGGGTVGPVEVTLADLTLNDVLTLNADDVGDDLSDANDYSFKLGPSALTGTGGLHILGGTTVVAPKALDLGTLQIDLGANLDQTGTGGDKDIIVRDILIFNGLANGGTVLDVSIQPSALLTSGTDVTIGLGNTLKLPGDFVAKSLTLAGALDQVASDDVSVDTGLRLDGVTLDMTGGRVLTTTEWTEVEVMGVAAVIDPPTPEIPALLTSDQAMTASSVAVGTSGELNLVGVGLTTMHGDVTVSGDGVLTVGAELAASANVDVNDSSVLTVGTTLNAVAGSVEGTMAVGGAATFTETGATSLAIAGGDFDSGSLVADSVDLDGGTGDVVGLADIATTLTVPGGDFNAGSLQAGSVSLSGSSIGVTGTTDIDTTLNVTGGTLTAGGDVNVPDVTASSGGGVTLDGGNLIVTNMTVARQSTVNTNANYAQISGQLDVSPAGVVFTAESGTTFEVSGANLSSLDVVRTLTLASSEVSVTLPTVVPPDRPMLLDSFNSISAEAGDPDNGVYSNSDGDGGRERRMKSDPNDRVVISGFTGDWDVHWIQNGGQGDNTDNCTALPGDLTYTAVGYEPDGLVGKEGKLNYGREDDDKNLGRDLDLGDDGVSEYWFSAMMQVNNDDKNEYGEFMFNFGPTPEDPAKRVAFGFTDDEDNSDIRLRTASSEVVVNEGFPTGDFAHLLIARIEVDRGVDAPETVTYWLDPTDVTSLAQLNATTDPSKILSISTDDFIGVGDKLVQFRFQGRAEDHNDDDKHYHDAIYFDELRVTDNLASAVGSGWADWPPLANTDLLVTASSTFTINGAVPALLGTVTLENSSTLTLAGTATDVTLGKLAGVGTVLGSFSIEGLAPGAGVGELAVTGDVLMVDQGVYEFELGNGTPFVADALNVTGELSFANGEGEGWTLQLSEDPTNPLETVEGLTDKYTLFTYGTLAGYDPADITVDYSNVPNWVFDSDTAGFENDTINNKILLTGLIEVSGLNIYLGSTTGLDYKDPANWTAGTIPDTPEEMAYFRFSLTEDSEVDFDDDVTVGVVKFESPTYSFTLVGDRLTLEGPSDTAGEVIVVSGDHAIENELRFRDGLTVDTATGTSLTLAPPDPYALDGEVSKDGAGTLVVTENTLLYGDLNVNAGVVNAGNGALANGDGTITIGDATLMVSGNVPRPIVMDGGADPYSSFIQATGPTTLGDHGANEFSFAGILNAADQTVTVLGTPGRPMVTWVLMSGGTLSGSPELNLAPGGIISGAGTVAGTVRLGDATTETPAGGLFGADPSNLLVLSGLVTGAVDAVGDIEFSGADWRGWSPTYTVGYNVNKTSETLFLIGGMEPGTLHTGPKGQTIGVEGDYTQYLIGGNEDTDGGAEPYQESFFDNPVLQWDPDSTLLGWGDLTPGELVLLHVGPANTWHGEPPFGKGLVARERGKLTYGEFFLDDLLDELANIAPQLPGGLSFGAPIMSEECLIITIIPEPGTLMMLIGGGFGLLLLVWRRRRKVS